MATSRRTRAGSGRQSKGSGSSRGKVAEEEPASSRRAGSSSRRDKAGSSRRGKAGSSSRRGKAGKKAADKKSKRQANDEGSRRGRAPRKDSKMGTIVTIVVAVLLIAGVTFGIMWPGIKRDMTLTKMEEAPDQAAAEQFADEFMALCAEENDPKTLISLAITQERGSVPLQIYMATKSEMPVDLCSIAKRPADRITEQERAEALRAAVELLRTNENPPNINMVPSQLLEWIKQEEREEKNRDLAIAAIDFVGVTKKTINGDDPAKILAAVVLDTDRDPKIIDTAVDNLSRVTGRGNVGFALTLLKSANADKIIEHGQDGAVLPPGVRPMLDRITDSVTPAVLDRIFELLEHEDERIQAAGVAFLKGGGLASINPDQREDIGRRIASYITAEMRETKPPIFSEALKSAVALRLSGARSAVHDMMTVVPADDPDAAVIADALGRAFILGEPESKEGDEEILRKLAQAIEDDNTRSTAAKAVLAVNEKGFTGLRICLEACIKHGTDPDCFAAARHIVNNLYGRKDVSQKIGDDLNAWVDFLAQDKPRFDHYAETEAWLTEAEKYIRATDDQEMLRANRVRVLKEKEEFEKWDVAPLGLEDHQIKEFKRRLGIYSQSVSKAIH